MNIFIDSVTHNCYLSLFTNDRKILHETYIEVKGNESSKLIPEIMNFLSKNNVNQDELENIVIVNGPGSFTGVRTAVLIANTMNFILKKDMTSLSYFDLILDYPIIKSSSKRDSFIQKSIDSEIEILSNSEVQNYLKSQNIKTLYGETSYDFENARIVEKIDYTRIIKDIVFKKKKKIEPLYIKKPNIS